MPLFRQTSRTKRRNRPAPGRDGTPAPPPPPSTQPQPQLPAPPPSSSTEHLAPPSEQEQALYYNGLRSRPRLVARSSPEHWESIHGPATRPGTRIRRLRLIQPASARHPLLGAWRGGRAALPQALLRQLRPLAPRAVEIFRVGFEDERDARLWPTTLMVPVGVGPAEWQVAARVAVACKAVLETHGIHDVHCEIRESTVRWLLDEL